jgi:alkanesulfonate monooxygenase SsuD/methylene tetrahydromethanopterin reductase-like flavin-dependent oxidoreductase (luciferase family)
MHVGYSAFFQNPERRLSDGQVYEHELRLARLAEPLGFESVWSTEHHFTDYLISPDVLQFLSYMAACTEKAWLGSMVVVLPWHDPIRVAEQVSVLDHLSGGRMILGLGRGLGRVEFEGFRVNMSDSREMFSEYAEIVLQGLETGVCEHAGKFIQQPRREIRPAPLRSFRDRTYAATMSPDSMPILARHGLGILVIPQKPWTEVEKDFAIYNATFREANGRDAPPPLAAAFICVDEDAGRAEEMAQRYIGDYYHSVMKHYELTAGHLANTKGYDFYHRVGKHIERHGADAAAQEFVELMPYGTPEQVIEKVQRIHRHVGNSGLLGTFSFGGMPYDVAERNLRLFAREVLPALKQIPVRPPAFAKSA